GVWLRAEEAALGELPATTAGRARERVRRRARRDRGPRQQHRQHDRRGAGLADGATSGGWRAGCELHATADEEEPPWRAVDRPRIPRRRRTTIQPDPARERDAGRAYGAHGAAQGG